MRSHRRHRAVSECAWRRVGCLSGSPGRRGSRAWLSRLGSREEPWRLNNSHRDAFGGSCFGLLVRGLVKPSFLALVFMGVLGFGTSSLLLQIKKKKNQSLIALFVNGFKLWVYFLLRRRRKRKRRKWVVLNVASKQS